MENTAHRAIAIVGVGAILPDAPNAQAFWENIKNGRYSITDVTPDRWNPDFYYDPDPAAPDKTYSKIGGWVREAPWDPIKWRLPIPPRVVEGMDEAQKWGVACTREALEDYGYPKRPLDPERTAVILGNAMAGEKHYLTALRVFFPEYAHELAESPSFAGLPATVRSNITHELHDRIAHDLPQVTEDSMPGELANCLAGRIANLFNFRGPNYTCDAACASAMAAISSAAEGLVQNHYDAVITGGIDRNMGAPTFVKFCKIGALSATGTRPYAQGADGFVMGEGAALFLLKRLADAERDGDKIYAVLRGIGGSSDGKGKGITAPNPIGQRLCVERAWKNAGLSPATVTYVEGHGTSTRVGDVVEAQSMVEILSSFHLPTGSVAIGSVKSNFGHLKGGAGSAGLLKATLALHKKVLPPSLHCDHPSPDIDFAHSPLYVNTELKPWTVPASAVRCAGVSAFGFGGTNFHTVLEEYVPGRLNGNGKRSVAVTAPPTTAEKTASVTVASPSPVQTSASVTVAPPPPAVSKKAPLRGALVIGAATADELAARLSAVHKEAAAGRAPAPAAPAEPCLRAPERLAIDYADAADLADKSAKALKALKANQPVIWKALRAQGVFRGQGPAGKVAFLYTGQGSQYVNMLRPLRAAEPIVAETFAEADLVMTPLLGKPLSEFIFVDPADANAVAKAEEDLRQTAITQPAVIASDIAMTRLLAAYGIQPDMTMGHSVGEYGALVASGALPFEDAMEAVSARGREMSRVSLEDKGLMVAVFAPREEIERVLKTVNGYVVIANINSDHQAVIGGATQAVQQAMEAFQKGGYEFAQLPVSHAFHTSIVAEASTPLRQMLARLRLQPPRLPIVANINGEFYPTGSDVVPQMLDILAQQVASPVQFVKGLHTLYNAGARVFVEVGPKKALQGFAENVFANQYDVVSLFTNHPKFGDIVAFNQTLCGLYAAGLGCEQPAVPVAVSAKAPIPHPEAAPAATIAMVVPETATALSPSTTPLVPSNGSYSELGRLVADALERSGWQLYQGEKLAPAFVPVTITGAALGLPGTEHIFGDGNVERILRGEQFIKLIPESLRRAMVDKHITRLVKSENGGPSFETITDVADVINLAGRGCAFDLEKEFGVSAERLAALDRTTQLAIAVGIDALRDAGIPLVMRYKTTSKGTQLPDRWGLPDSLRDDTGVIYASAFPSYESFAQYISGYHIDHARREQLAMLQDFLPRLVAGNGHSPLTEELTSRVEELRGALEKEPFLFDRRFLFRVLSMGHSQFAEYIGARGPNTQINSACASTTQAVSLAEDWIRAGRCRRVIVVSADDITTDGLMEWMGAGFLASGAAATDKVVEEAAIPFDRRRHGMIIGMGAAGMVVEGKEAARERGIQPICEVVSAATANSAFHGTRLDVEHIGQVMESLITKAETRCGISRHEIAPRTVFVSHETYTPARGGSASAEIFALRRVFGDDADKIVIANTKGLTGHAMGAGVEDIVAVKALETGCVPPVANFKEVDPKLGQLNLSKGGPYPVEYALRLGAGFGSQISMTLYRWFATKDAVRPRPNALGYAYRIADTSAWNSWLAQIAGRPAAELEVVKRTLRVKDQGLTKRVSIAAGGSRTAPAPAPIAQAAPQAERVAFAVVAPSAAPLRPATEAKPSVPASVAVAAAVVPPPSPKTARAPATAPTATTKPEDKPAPAPAAVKQEVKPAPPQPAATFAQDSRGDPVKERILALVVEKTGYPKDMLDLDLDLEADLGVDTVKQAEMFAAIRETYNIPRDENRNLRDYPTLAHVIRFVLEKRPDLAGEGATAQSAATVATPPVVTAAAVPTAEAAKAEPTAEPLSLPTAPTSDGGSVKERILALVVEKTGYPRDMLDLDLDLEADLGVDTVKQAEMFAAIREIYNIPRDENRKLRDYPTLAHVIRFVLEMRPDLFATLPSPATTSQPTTTSSRGLLEFTAAGPATEPGAAVADSIKAKVLQIVAEKTGYPQEMLDLDLDLEADLGIDTVKQAEMFAAIRGAYNIPRDENLKLRDFPSVAHVIKFAQERSSLIRAQEEEVTKKTTASPPSPSKVPSSAKRISLDAANTIPRRVPLPVLRPPVSLCKPTSVKLEAPRRVIIMPDKGGVAEALAQSLRGKGVEVLSIGDAPDAEVLTGSLRSWMAAGSVDGVYWLSALDNEGRFTTMDSAAWHKAVSVRIKLLYTTMRALYMHIAKPGTFLVSATRLGGQHGYDEAGAFAPLGGAVVGFIKTYKRERTEALVKAVDFESESEPAEIAERLIEETLRDPGAVEIGYKNGLRWTVGLQEQPAADGQPGLTLDSKTVFLITGAAGSIVSAITADLAAASGGTFYLLDLVPEPDPDNPDLKRFVNDKEGLKRDIFARIRSRGVRATPALVEGELAGLERAQAAQSAIDAVRAAGGTPTYFSVNLTDANAVTTVIDQVRERSGRIDVLLHAAGLDRSHSLPDKEPGEFDLVFDVKSDGFFNLLHAIGDMPLGVSVAFSSIAGRFGNLGQTDYAAANDLLCKITSSFRTTRQATRGIAIDWTAWGGIGMASRGSIPKVMEMAGIDMLRPEAGTAVIRNELTAGGTRGEVVIGERLGVLLKELDETGGLDISALETTADTNTRAQGPMFGKIAGGGLFAPLRIETTLDPKIQPFLYDHQIDGTPVLPGVMGIEAFAEAALALLPGWHVEAIEQVSYQAPFKFYRNEPRTVNVEALIHPQGTGLVAECQLIGTRTIANQADPQVTTHFTARLRLTKEAAGADVVPKLSTPVGSAIDSKAIYGLYFHGPAYQVVEKAWWNGKSVIGLMARNLPENHHPPDLPTMVAPRLIELCFQTAGIWEMGMQARMGLPLHIDRVSFMGAREMETSLYAVVTPCEEGRSFKAEVMDTKGNCYLRLSGYRTAEVPNGINVESAKTLRAAISLEPALAW